MNNLLERAKNHKNAEEGREILGETFEALKSGDLERREAKEINQIVGKRIKEATKDLNENGESEYLN